MGAPRPLEEAPLDELQNRYLRTETRAQSGRFFNLKLARTAISGEQCSILLVEDAHSNTGQNNTF